MHEKYLHGYENVVGVYAYMKKYTWMFTVNKNTKKTTLHGAYHMFTRQGRGKVHVLVCVTDIHVTYNPITHQLHRFSSSDA